MSIKESRKFQYLIQRQENKICKEQIKNKQAQINEQIEDLNDQKKQLNNLEKSIDERQRIEKSIRDQIRQEEQDARVIL